MPPRQPKSIRSLCSLLPYDKPHMAVALGSIDQINIPMRINRQEKYNFQYEARVVPFESQDNNVSSISSTSSFG